MRKLREHRAERSEARRREDPGGLGGFPPQKFRYAFALVAVLAIALCGVLVYAVHRSIDVERAARHRMLAERTFDEMERSLTAIIERDDQRSRRGDRNSSEPAALGYFEHYHDPRNFGGQERWLSPSPLAADAARRAMHAPPLARDALRQRPGTTVWLSRPGAADEVPAYRALAALNRGADRHDGFSFGAYEVDTTPELVLVYRRLAHPSGSHLEGVVLERRTLRDWLAAQTLAGTSFSRSLTLVRADAALATVADPFVYRHRFARPFDELAAVLIMEPISDGSGSTYFLVALLAIAVGASLLMAYRASAARVRLAEHQSQFVSAVTHELRTPLTTLRMYSEMLRDDIVPPDSRRQYCDAMVLEAERLSRLVENVLSHAKIARREPVVAVRAQALPPTVEHALSMLEPHASAHGLALETQIERDLPPVLVDRDAITQVLVNLVDNAVVHTAETAQPRVIEVCCERRGKRVALSVRDHGEGVARGLLDDIFAPFVSTQMHGRGVGLGLALARSLVVQMGGDIFAENAAGGGLRVAVLLRTAPGL